MTGPELPSFVNSIYTGIFGPTKRPEFFHAII